MRAPLYNVRFIGFRAQSADILRIRRPAASGVVALMLSAFAALTPGRSLALCVDGKVAP